VAIGFEVSTCTHRGLRIAWLVRNRDEAMTMLRHPHLQLYLNAKDAGRFFLRAVEAKGIGFAVLFAASL